MKWRIAVALLVAPLAGACLETLYMAGDDLFQRVSTPGLMDDMFGPAQGAVALSYFVEVVFLGPIYAGLYYERINSLVAYLLVGAAVGFGVDAGLYFGNGVTSPFWDAGIVFACLSGSADSTVYWLIARKALPNRSNTRDQAS